MQYRRLGRSGLQVSLLSLGSWVTYHNQVDTRAAQEMLAAAMDAGVNFFDNAEAYARGHSEVVMGEAIRALKWPRLNYIVSTKFFWGLDRSGDGINRKDTLNRKYLMQALDGSLRRFGLDFVDLIYCHRPDPHTPIEETVWAMNTLIQQGKILYWGTSEWASEEIMAAFVFAEKNRLIGPTMEQPQYNMFERTKLEKDFLLLFRDFGLGTTIWSPLASGLLTGKYNTSMPTDNRLHLEGMDWLKERTLSDATRIEKTRPRGHEMADRDTYADRQAAGARNWPAIGKVACSIATSLSCAANAFRLAGSLSASKASISALRAPSSSLGYSS